MKSAKFKLGEWLPDMPDLDNSGLTEAKGVLFISEQYKPYRPLTPTFTPALPNGLPLAAIQLRSSGIFTHVVSFDQSTWPRFYVQGASTWTDVSPVTHLATPTQASMAQFGNYSIVALGTLGNPSSLPQFIDFTVGTNYSKLTGPHGDAPTAGIVGVIGQFLMLGNVGGVPGVVQWSAIGAPLDWPTPLSAAAIASQSGQQSLAQDLGYVQGFTQGDQTALILCDGGIVRVTYNGGATVFQFDTVFRQPGPVSQDAWVKVGNDIYFASKAGFFETNGVSVAPIGRGKVDEYFLGKVDLTHSDLVRAGIDYVNHLIYWTLPKSSDGGSGPQEMLAYNYESKRWTHVFDSVRVFVSSQQALASITPQCQALGNNSKLGTFSGTPGTATLTTGEAELNPGGKAFVTGFRPQVSGSPSALSVKIGSRDNQGDSVTLSAADSPDAFTGSCNFMVDARYLRAEIDITGAFTQAMGGEFEATASSGL